MTTTTNYKPTVGDIFGESWGYDQTNTDFYEVVKVSATGQTVTLRAVEAERVEVGTQMRLMPKRGHYRNQHTNGSRNFGSGAPFTRRVKGGWRGEVWLNMTRYSGASLWDGTPQYDTMAAGDMGH